MTPARSASTAAVPQWRRAARGMFRGHLFTGLWLWGVLIVTSAVALTLVNLFGEVNQSSLQYVVSGALWYPFAFSIILSSQLGIHIANGLTRRAFVIAAAVTAVVVGVVYAVLTATGLAIEGAVFDAFGWPHRITEDAAPLVIDESSLAMVAGWSALAYTSTQLCGFLVGATYYRFGGWWGTAALPFTLLPVIVVNLATGVSAGQWRPFDVAVDFPTSLTVVMVLGVIVATIAALYLVTRRVAVRPRQA